MPGLFQNFIAGQQAGQARQEFTQGQGALARQQQFNQLAAQYLGTDTVQSLGVPTSGGPPAQALAPPAQPVDESQGPPQYPPQSAFAAPQGAPPPPDPRQQMLSQLVALDPGRALELEKVRTGRMQQQQGEIYNLATRALKSGKPAVVLKYLLSADTIGGLNVKAVREGMQQQGVDIQNLNDEQSTAILQSIIARSAAAAGILPKDDFTLKADETRFSGDGTVLASGPSATTNDIRDYERAKSEGDPRSFAQYMLDMKRAGASNTNVNLPETKYPNKFQEGLATSDVGRLDALQKRADSSRALSQTLDELGTLNETALASGGANAKLEVANWIKGITGSDLIDPKVLAGSQKYNALIKKSILDSLGGSLGVGVSNSDVAFMEKTVPQLEYSRQAREELIRYMKRRSRENVLAYDHARAYGERTGGLKGYRPPKTATNKETGARMMQIDGKWVDLDADPEQ